MNISSLRNSLVSVPMRHMLSYRFEDELSVSDSPGSDIPGTEEIPPNRRYQGGFGQYDLNLREPLRRNLAYVNPSLVSSYPVPGKSDFMVSAQNKPEHRIIYQNYFLLTRA